MLLSQLEASILKETKNTEGHDQTLLAITKIQGMRQLF